MSAFAQIAMYRDLAPRKRNPNSFRDRLRVSIRRKALSLGEWPCPITIGALAAREGATRSCLQMILCEDWSLFWPDEILANEYVGHAMRSHRMTDKAISQKARCL